MDGEIVHRSHLSLSPAMYNTFPSFPTSLIVASDVVLEVRDRAPNIIVFNQTLTEYLNSPRTLRPFGSTSILRAPLRRLTSAGVHSLSAGRYVSRSSSGKWAIVVRNIDR
jgi:hypothetical protein